VFRFKGLCTINELCIFFYEHFLKHFKPWYQVAAWCWVHPILVNCCVEWPLDDYIKQTLGVRWPPDAPFHLVSLNSVLGNHLMPNSSNFILSGHWVIVRHPFSPSFAWYGHQATSQCLNSCNFVWTRFWVATQHVINPILFELGFAHLHDTLVHQVFNKINKENKVLHMKHMQRFKW